MALSAYRERSGRLASNKTVNFKFNDLNDGINSDNDKDESDPGRDNDVNKYLWYRSHAGDLSQGSMLGGLPWWGGRVGW